MAAAGTTPSSQVRVQERVLGLMLLCACVHVGEHVHTCVCVLHAQSHPTLCDLWAVARQAPLSMGILQAGILEWVAMPSFRGSSRLRGRTQAPCSCRQRL